MKFIIKREDILPALTTVNGVIERRQTLPVLSNLLLNVKKDSLTLTGTDMEVELVTTISQPVGVEGETTLPARKLLDICRALPDESELSINVSGDKATVTSERSRFTLSPLPAQEFPLVDSLEPTFEFEIKQGEFKSPIFNKGGPIQQQLRPNILPQDIFPLRSFPLHT